MDLTRKQLTRERATWTVRLDGEADRAGRVEAEIVGRRRDRAADGARLTRGGASLVRHGGGTTARVTSTLPSGWAPRGVR